MKETKPCPYCGNKKVSVGWDYDPIFGVKSYSVDCTKCHISGPIKGTEEEAINAWNKRS